MVLSSEDQNEVIKISKWALKYCYNLLTNKSLINFDDVMLELTSKNPKLVPFHTTNRDNYLTIITNTKTLDDFFTYFFLFTGIMNLIEEVEDDVIINEISRVLQFSYQKIHSLKHEGN